MSSIIEETIILLLTFGLAGDMAHKHLLYGQDVSMLMDSVSVLNP